MISELVLRKARLQIHEVRNRLQQMDKDLESAEWNLNASSSPMLIDEVGHQVRQFGALIQCCGWDIITTGECEGGARALQYEED